MRLDEAAADCQSETHAGNPTSDAARMAVELLERSFAILVFESRSGIRDMQGNPIDERFGGNGHDRISLFAATGMGTGWPFARARLANEAQTGRIGIVEGDFFCDPLPDGQDVLIVANTVHVLSAAHNIALLTNMRAHVATGARLLLVDLWMDASHTQPPVAPLAFDATGGVPHRQPGARHDHRGAPRDGCRRQVPRPRHRQYRGARRLPHLARRDHDALGANWCCTSGFAAGAIPRLRTNEGGC
jgi:hypothetical protein